MLELENNLNYEAYLRKSSESGERQALSIPAQKKEILAKFPNFNIVRWVIESRSAYEAENRPDFDAMLDRLKRGVSDGIVSWKPNRLSRNALEAGLIAHYINKGFIKDLQFVSYTFEKTPDGIKRLQEELVDSQYYSANLSVDVRRGNQEKREQGWLPTANLSGYVNVPNPNLSEEDPSESITAIDSERFHLLRQAWDLLLTDEYSVPAILDILNNQWGYRTRKTRKKESKPLCRASLYKIFNNIRYAGKIPDPITGGLFNGRYPAMVTVDEYNKAQDILGKRGKPHMIGKREFAYKGIAICGECGCSITAEQKRDWRYIFYHCTHKRKNYKCKQPSIEEKELIRQLDDLFGSLSIRKDFQVLGAAAMQALNGGESAEKQKIIETQKNAIKAATDKIERLLDLITNGIITPEQYKEKLSATEAEAAALQKQLDSISNNSTDWREAMRKTLDVLCNGRERFINGDVFAKREILQSLGSNTVIIDKKLYINTYKWLEPIKKEYKALEVEFDKVRTGDLQIKTASIEAVNLRWYSVINEVRTIMMRSDLSPLLSPN